MINRLKLFMDSEGIIASQFADSIGIARSSFSQLMTGRNKSVNDVTLSKIHAAYPMLSIQWLLFGEGEMLVDSDYSTSEAEVSDEDEPSKQLTIFDENGLYEYGKPGGHKYEKEIGVNPVTYKITRKPHVESESEHEAEDSVIEVPADRSGRRVARIMVLYSDNSYECFIPE